MLFGNESADAAHHQVGIRVAHPIGRPVVGGVKAIELADGMATLHRSVEDGFEVCEVPLPAVAAVKEGINIPRYPAMRGRLMASRAQIRRLHPERRAAGLTMVRMRHQQQEESETVMLGTGAAAAPAVVRILEEVGLL